MLLPCLYIKVGVKQETDAEGFQAVGSMAETFRKQLAIQSGQKDDIKQTQGFYIFIFVSDVGKYSSKVEVTVF